MASTTNLEIEKLNNADYVSVEPINDAFDKLDALGVDYVTESGTSGEWWYRKWKSGRAECGIDQKTFDKVRLTAWGSLYISQSYTFGSLPITFAAVPYVGIMFVKSSSGRAGGIIHVRATSATASKCPDFSVTDATEADYGQPTFGCFVSGRWK
jgi:hypothetical protein